MFVVKDKKYLADVERILIAAMPTANSARPRQFPPVGPLPCSPRGRLDSERLARTRARPVPSLSNGYLCANPVITTGYVVIRRKCDVRRDYKVRTRFLRRMYDV